MAWQEIAAATPRLVDPQAVLAVEVNPTIAAAYTRLHPLTPMFIADAADKHWWSRLAARRCTIVTMGIRCQSFVRVGRQGGLTDPRGRDIYIAGQVLWATKPIWSLVETSAAALEDPLLTRCKRRIHSCGLRVRAQIHVRIHERPPNPRAGVPPRHTP